MKTVWVICAWKPVCKMSLKFMQASGRYHGHIQTYIFRYSWVIGYPNDPLPKFRFIIFAFANLNVSIVQSLVIKWWFHKFYYMYRNINSNIRCQLRCWRYYEFFFHYSIVTCGLARQACKWVSLVLYKDGYCIRLKPVKICITILLYSCNELICWKT